MEIVVGTKKWSSWSLRPWLALKRTGQPFKETVIELRQAGASEAEIAKHSPSHLVPALKDGDLVVWDSLAICEYLAETFPAAKLWPQDAALRALGRSAAAEMHSGFSSLRGECPMALEVAPAAVAISEATQKDVRKIVERWNQLLKRSGGPFLLGDWSIADAFYTPVATRFRTYGIHLSDYGDTGAAGAYCERLLQTPEFLAWEADSLA
ncbi:glutathione S-transferase family protein [Caulobacter rhizosphaerae]|jgi:glutathione S-transferase|uniref:glutathione S-transferase family protein n=1 Tax=Caulobacter rhizosphaerae TaxID=2010972 RepID=UPI0013D8991F|nr:glutathione S-transferase family protein [Caulobacter rhizosphaerae]GGL09237.1 glutathione S-transferase [Caulobacter rhizosphaerae]